MARSTGRAWALRGAFALLVLGGCAGDEGPDGARDGGVRDDSAAVPQPPPLGIACEQFDELERACANGCAPSWDCRAAYGSLAEGDQLALEACTDCLLENLEAGVCADCADSSASVTSCRDFMEQLLGVSCW